MLLNHFLVLLTHESIYFCFFFAEVVAVRTDLLEQIPALAVRITECSPKYPQLATVISQYLIPIIVRNLGKSDGQVRNAAHSALFTLLEQGLLTKEEAEITVCPTILAMSKMESIIDLNTSAITVSFHLFFANNIVGKFYVCF